MSRKFIMCASKSWIPVVLGMLIGLTSEGCIQPETTPLKKTPPSRPPARGGQAVPSGGRGGEVGTFPNLTIDVNGKPREYRLVVPTDLDPKKPVPLVFAYHGIFEGKDYMPLYSHLDGLAAQQGFILVYPNGRDLYWPLTVELARDDLAFFDALYDHLTKQYNVDLRRVYLVGMSNGAYFSHIIASQRDDKIAAIAVHSGGLGVFNLYELNVTHKYPVMIVHGDADTVVIVTEGRLTRDAYKKWGHEVEYIELPGHGHLWAYKEGINERIWDFLKVHPLY